MAQGAFEGGVISIRGDASQVKEELSEVSKLLTELEKNKVKLKPEIDINNVKKDINKLEQYMQGRFGALDFSKIYSSLMKTASRNPNDFVKQLERTMHGVNLLDQAVKPEDISKLAAASAEEMLELINGLGKLATSTKATGTPVTKRLQALYDKYPNGIEGLSGSGKGGGFGASEEALNKIGETLERIDINVKSINDSIQTGAITVQAVAESAENVVDKTKQAADAQAELTRETEQAARAEEQLGQAQEKNNKQKKEASNKKEGSTNPKEKKTEKNEESTKPKNTNKPKSFKEDVKNQKPDGKKATSTQSVDASSIKEVQQEQKKLGQATEETTKKLKEQQKIIQENGQKPDHKNPFLEQRKQNDKEFREKINEIEKQVKVGELSQSEETVKKLDAKISWLEKYISIEKASNKALEQDAQKWEAIRQSDHLNGSYQNTWDSIISHERQLQLAKDQKAKLLQEQSPESTIEEIETFNVESAQEGVKVENELKNAVEEVNQALIEQNATNNDLSSSGATNNLQQLSESQKELGENVHATTELLREQDQVLQETNDSSSAKELGFKEAVQMAGDAEGTQKFVYSIDEAEAKLKEVKKKYKGKKDEEAQLSPVDAQEVWNAINSLDQISWISSDTDADRITQILDQYTDWTDVYLGQDLDSKNIKIDAFSKIFERISKYQEAFNKSNPLEQLRDLYNLDIEQRSSIMTPDNTVEGYTYALDRIKLILDVMDQYKAAIEDAQSKGKEITEADQKFLDNYDQTRNQWTRANERAQRNLEPLQEQERLKEETKQRIAQEKEDEKQRRIFKQKLKRENRQARIDEDQQFEADFQNYDIKNIENMDLEEIDRQIHQMEEYKQKALELKGEFNQLEETIKQNNSYGESKFDDETIALMRPTDQESQWLAGYKARMAKRKEYAEALKKRKSQLNKELSQKKEENAKDNGQENVDQAQNNAEKAQEAANKAKKAADESEEAVRRVNDAQKKLKQDTPKDTGKTSVTESANANQTAQNNAKNVEESKEVLESNLSQLQNQVNKLQDRKKKLEKTKEQLTDTKKYDDTFFEIDSQESGKTAKKYRKDKTEEVTEELKKLEADLEKKQTELQKVQERINNINAIEQQVSDSQPQIESTKKKKSKKSKIIMPTQEQQQGAVDGQIQTQVENEKKNTDAAQQLGDQTQQTNDNLEKAKDLSDIEQQLLNSIFGSNNEKGGGKTGKGSGLQSESETISHLINALKDLPSATQALSEFDAVNSNIAGNAQGAANAIQAEANAFSSMTQATQGVNSKQLITSDKRDTGLLEIESTGNELKEIEQKKDQYKKITDQIKIIEDGRIQAEEEIARYSTSDKNFKVGRSKNKTYDLIKTYAEQLKQDYEAYEKLDPNDTSDKAKEIIAKYENSRVAFSKAVSKMVANGLPKDKGDESVGFWELSNKHGVGSKGFDEAEKHVADNLKFLEERLNQQKQQAEIVLNKLYAERDRLQQELTSPSSQANVLANGNNLPADKPDLGGGQSANGIRTKGAEAGDAAAKMQALADAKKQVTEANQKLSQSAQETTNSLNGEAGAGINTSEAFDPKPLQQEIDALKQVSEQQKKTIDEQKQAIDELQKKQEQATNEKIANLQKENEALTAQQRKELEQRRQAELDTQKAIELQKKQFEEDEKIRKEQEAKTAQKAEERAKKVEENARIKTEDKDFSKLYTEYGKDYSAILDAKSVQEFDMAVAHLTETERQFWEARMLQAGGSAYAHQADMLKQNDLPEGYEKSVDNQTAVLKQREMAIAEYTANVIAELEKQEAAFEKMDTVYKTATDNPNHARKDFIDSSLVDRNQTQKYTYAIDDVTKSLQRMREIIQSMKDDTFDFGNVDALRELLELRQNLSNQMSTAKDADKAYKKAQGDIEADSVKQVEQYKTVLNGLQKQIEGIQKDSKKLINPDNDYKSRLTEAKTLLETIQNIINNLNKNPLQFIGENGQKNARNTQAFIDESKQLVDEFQEDFNSQKGVQGRINTYFTSYKGAYTSFFREIKDSFKSQALGELQNEIDRTFKTFEESIVNLNRATGLNQGEFLDKYLNTNGGKATASQIEQQQKVRNAIAENYRGLITDISNELTKVQDKMGNVLGEKFLNKDYFQENFGEQFVAGLGDTNKFAEFQNSAQIARDNFIELQKIQKQMADGKLDLTQLAPDELKNRIQEIVKLFADLNVNYEKVVDSAKEFTLADMGDIEKQRAGITQFLKSNRGISSEARAYLQDYFNQLQQGISQADLTKLTDGWHQVADAEQAAGRTGATFMSELLTRFRSLSAYLLSFVSFYRVIGVFKDGINIIHELDDALTEMQKVSDESLNSLKEYQQGTFATANEIGTTAAQLQQSTADWLRLGKLNCLFI